MEFDPHAFLFWPDKGLVVLPMMQPFRGEFNQPPTSGALVLRVSGDALTEVGTVSHPVDPRQNPDSAVRRSMVIGDELWTVSGAGVMVNDLDKLAQRAWIPFR